MKRPDTLPIPASGTPLIPTFTLTAAGEVVLTLKQGQTNYVAFVLARNVKPGRMIDLSAQIEAAYVSAMEVLTLMEDRSTKAITKAEWNQRRGEIRGD